MSNIYIYIYILWFLCLIMTHKVNPNLLLTVDALGGAALVPILSDDNDVDSL